MAHPRRGLVGPIDLDVTDGPALSLVRPPQVEPALVLPPPPKKQSVRTSTRLSAHREPKLAPAARVSKGGVGVGVQARPTAPSLPLDAVVEVPAEQDAAARAQCW
uniref:Uncharacterized protein n=1 Tax=Coccolithus braarudii TaxID=221442 RepID=A0A7S0LBD3_9EUKA|mmetsp:Transcript_31242/g.67101  ORF Transcript_31242/g.67101 Transcript_31242/m.67101 type:complete len:105 (+) Transcript_31242:2-316(+)